jgi:NitT/TauT family transport system substrate-binding protein
MKPSAARCGVVVGLVVSALALSCGGKKTEKESPAPAGSGTAAAPAGEGQAPAGREYQIGWFVWTGYVPYKLMETKGFLARRAAEKGIKVKLVEFPAYMDAVTAFASGKLDGCSMSATDTLTAAAAGVETVAILVHDTSEGGDGVLVRGIDDLRGLKARRSCSPSSA